VQFQACIRELTGKGAGLPVWGIVPQIREVDALMTPDLQHRVREFHPELTWKRLAGSLLASKHGAEGLLQRIDLLNRHNPHWAASLTAGSPRSNIKLDDILDAIVGISAAHAIAGDLGYRKRFPRNDPPKDERGLRMEIWF
jgi:predicted RNase H-like nuclease